MPEELIKPSKDHWIVISAVLIVEREKAGFLSQDAFATACGWSQQFQSQIEDISKPIEHPGEHKIRITIAEKICEVLYGLNNKITG